MADGRHIAIHKISHISKKNRHSVLMKFSTQMQIWNSVTVR